MLLNVVVAQQSITISGSGLGDVMIYRNLRPGYEYTVNTNYAAHPRIAAVAWTASGYKSYMRSLLSFQLSAIPSGSTIQSATLYFYSDPNISGSSDANGNSQLSGSNAFYLEKITSAWNEFSVTWNTQPSTTTADRVWVGPSVSTTENRQINITNIVQGWVNNPQSNFGLKMFLENEVHYRSRNYASKNHMNTALHPKLVITYTEPDPLKQRMDHIFGVLDQSFIHTGILTDYGIDLANHTLFDGTIRTDNEMDMNTWRALYGSLLSSVINPSSNMIHLTTINDRLRTYAAGYNRNNRSVDLPTLFIACQMLREDAVSQNLIYIENERLKDVAGRSQSPYITSHAFATAPSIGYDDDGEVSFVWRNSLFVNSSSKSISTFQVDFDDGTGYRTVSSDIPINITYSTEGKKNLKFRITFTDASVYNSHAAFTVLSISSSRSSGQARYTGLDGHEYIFPRDSDPNCPEFFADPEGGFGATVTVEYGTIGMRTAPDCANLPQFIRPFIVLEGYDPAKFSDLVESNWDYNNFINARINGAINVDSDPIMAGAQWFGDRLEAAGYDLIFVDFNEGTGDIVGNALLVENIIRWVNAHKIVNPNTGVREQNVVLGQSMGGLVARYAVSDLEKRWNTNPASNPHHEVRLLVTQDAPHRGANVPLGFQAMVNDLAPYRLTKIGLSTFGVTGAIIGSMIEMRDLVPALDQADQLLDEDASEQMLVVQDGKSNTFLDGTYRSMISFASGYTPTFQLRAIANGSECGVGQILQPGGELLYAEGNFYVNRLAYLVASHLIAAGATAINPGLGVVVLGVLYTFVPLTGKNWKTKFIVRAAPSSGTNQAFYGSISFEKKILLVIPVNVSLFSSTRNSISGALPWDSAPGGYYSLRDIQATVPGTNINVWPIIDINLTVRLESHFNFVSTVSALDVTTNPLTPAVITSPYTGGNNPTYPSRFANFITQERTAPDVIGSIYNTRHVQFTARNADWLLNIMNGANPLIACSYLCNGTSTSPSVTGADAVCADEMYTLNNPNGATGFDWNQSANLSPASADGGTTYTVSANGEGNGFVQVILNGACGNSNPFVKNIDVGGGYSSSDYPVSGPSSVCTNQYAYYSTNDLPLATNYSWFWPTDWQYSAGQGTRFLDLYVTSTSTSGSVGVRVATACDQGGSPATLFTTVSSCGSFMMTAYPNPAQSELIIESADATPGNQSDTLDVERQLRFTAKLYDSSGELRKTGRSAGEKLTMTIDDLSEGQYFLHIITDLETVMSQIVIKR